MHHELGQILTGDTTYTTKYDLQMNINGTFCQTVCKKKFDNERDFKFYKWAIEQEYKATWYADGLPGGLNLVYLKGDEKMQNEVLHESGIPLGDKVYVNDETRLKIYNHLTFIISVHKHHSKDSSSSEDLYSVVDFSMIPYRYDIINIVLNILMKL
jgi:hypothetical protein